MKKTSLAQTIIQLVALAALFIPVSFIRYFNKISSSGIVNYQYSESLFEATDLSGNMIWGIALIIFGIISLVYFILGSAGKLQLSNKKIYIAIPLLSLPCLIGCLVSLNNYSYQYSDGLSSEVYGVSWGFYLICALYLTIFALELYKHFSNVEK